VIRAVTSFLIAGSLIFGAAPAAAGPAADPVVFDALLPITGSGAFIGMKKVATLDLIAAYVNQTGGIDGRPLKIVVHDDASNAQVGVAMTATLIAGHARVILGSVLAGICNAVDPIVNANGPLTYCYSPNVYPRAGSYMFSASLSTPDTITKMLQYFRVKHLTRIALIASTDASGEDFDGPFTAALASRPSGLQLVDHERFNITDLSVAAQMARIKAAQPQVLMIQAVGPAFGTVLRNANDAGLKVATFGAAGNLSYAQLAAYRTFASELFFVTAGGAAPVNGAQPQQAHAQSIFFASLKAAKIRPEYLLADTWDPPMLLVDALRRLGPDATPAQLRDYVDSLDHWWGVSGLYNFRLRPQRGLGYDAAIIDHWVAATNEVDIL
jgi:branched-chain amino acid transport system substrate-binding protein